MSNKVQLIYSLTAEDIKRVQTFLHRDERMNVLQRLVIFFMNKARDRSEKTQEKREESKYEFDDNVVSVTDLNDVDSVPWTYFSEIVEYDDGYLLMSKNRQIHIVIPKRVFEDKHVEVRFRSLIRLKLGFNAKLQLL